MHIMEPDNLDNPCDSKYYPSTGMDRLLGLQKFEAPRFQDNRHMKMVRSALRTGHLYPKKTSLLLISVKSWVEPTAIVGLKELCQWKMIPSGMEAATVRLVAQCLNQLRYCVFVKVHNQN
jgi:hypothetical protein